MFKKPTTVTLTHALRINDYGCILALGERREGLQRRTHAFLLQPRLGIDRWWATAGSKGSLEVNWTICPPIMGSRALTTLRVEQGESWVLSKDATVTLVPVGLEKASEPASLWTTLGWTWLDQRDGGLYILRISQFEVPDEPVIEKVRFTYKWGGCSGPLTTRIWLLMLPNRVLTRVSGR